MKFVIIICYVGDARKDELLELLLVDVFTNRFVRQMLKGIIVLRRIQKWFDHDALLERMTSFERNLFDNESKSSRL